MKLRYLEIIGAVLVAIVIAVIIALTAPFSTLSSARLHLLLIASGLYAISLFLWSAVWVFLVGQASSLPIRKQDACATSRSLLLERARLPVLHRRYDGTFAISMVSLIGILTPMNIGTDFLRSFYGKRYLGLPLKVTAAGSVLTREFKLHVTLLLVVCLVISSVSVQENFIKTLIIPVATVIFLLAILYSLRTNFAGHLAKRLKIGDISEVIRKLNLRLAPAKRCLIYSAFATGFVLEWLSLHLCFLALNLKPTLSMTFVLFALLYFLSRTPLIPQGLGVVEVSGFALLRMMAISTAQMGALLVMWDFLRIFIPIGLYIAFSISLPRIKERHSNEF